MVKAKREKENLTSMLMIRMRPEEHRKLKIWSSNRGDDMSKVIRGRLSDIIEKKRRGKTGNSDV